MRRNKRAIRTLDGKVSNVGGGDGGEGGVADLQEAYDALPSPKHLQIDPLLGISFILEAGLALLSIRPQENNHLVVNGNIVPEIGGLTLGLENTNLWDWVHTNNAKITSSLITRFLNVNEGAQFAGGPLVVTTGQIGEPPQKGVIDGQPNSGGIVFAQQLLTVNNSNFFLNIVNNATTWPDFATFKTFFETGVNAAWAGLGSLTVTYDSFTEFFSFHFALGPSPTNDEVSTISLVLGDEFATNLGFSPITYPRVTPPGFGPIVQLNMGSPSTSATFTSDVAAPIAEGVTIVTFGASGVNSSDGGYMELKPNGMKTDTMTVTGLTSEAALLITASDDITVRSSTGNVDIATIGGEEVTLSVFGRKLFGTHAASVSGTSNTVSLGTDFYVAQESQTPAVINDGTWSFRSTPQGAINQKGLTVVRGQFEVQLNNSPYDRSFSVDPESGVVNMQKLLNPTSPNSLYTTGALNELVVFDPPVSTLQHHLIHTTAGGLEWKPTPAKGKMPRQWG